MKSHSSFHCLGNQSIGNLYSPRPFRNLCILVLMEVYYSLTCFKKKNHYTLDIFPNVNEFHLILLKSSSLLCGCTLIYFTPIYQHWSRFYPKSYQMPLVNSLVHFSKSNRWSSWLSSSMIMSSFLKISEASSQELCFPHLLPIFSRPPIFLHSSLVFPFCFRGKGIQLCSWRLLAPLYRGNHPFRGLQRPPR